MKKFYSALLFSTIISVSSQEILWQKDIQSNAQDFLSNLTTTLDRQFLISGSTIHTSKISGVISAGTTGQNNGYDYHLLKLNQQGNTVWEKYYGGNQHDFLTTTISTQEGGFILAGTSFSPEGLDKTESSLGGSDVWIIKVNENGEEEWQKTLGSEMDDEAKSVVQSSDLGYFIAGNIQNYKAGFGSKDVWIAKLDKNGKVINQILMGGSGLEEVEKMIPTKDGGALIAVYSRSHNSKNLLTEKRELLKQLRAETNKKFDNSKVLNNSNAAITDKQTQNQTSNENNSQANIQNSTESLLLVDELYAKQEDNFGEGDYWIIKLDATGKLQWQKNFGGKEDDHVRTLSITSKGYLIGGESRSSTSGNKRESIKEGTDVWLIALDENGEEKWQTSYSFGNRDILMSQNTLWNVDNTEAKGYLLGGYTQAEEKKEKNDETFWMLYLDNKGKEVWRKHIEGKSKKEQERLVAANLNQDGTYILAGTSAEELGKENWKIVMLGDKQVQELIKKRDIQIYPNPVDDYCYVEIGVKFNEATIEVYDMSGKQVQNLKTKNPVTKLKTASLPQGVYIITAKTENQKLNAKIIKK